MNGGLAGHAHRRLHWLKLWNDLLLDRFQYKLLKLIAPTEPMGLDGSAYNGKSKLRTLLGNDIFDLAKDKVVIDFGCGTGQESVELAESGARLVIGVDIQEGMLSQARRRARLAGVQDRCVFSTKAPDCADVITSLDSFEHFSDPSATLREIWELVKPGGCLIASFGPTWYHPLGGHLFSVFPWAHLIFSEKALIRWRNDIRDDGARSFGEVAGGLNQMTINRFLEIVQGSPFEVDYIRTVPIRRLSILHNRLTQEFTTSTVQCKLNKPRESNFSSPATCTGT
jgi:SAM-dependent methyltransferase